MMQFSSRLAPAWRQWNRVQKKKKESSCAAAKQAAQLGALAGLLSIPAWSAVASTIPFVAPILSLNTGVQAVVYACSSIGGMAGFIAAWKHEHSWSGIGAKALEYGSVGAMCIGFPLFLTAIIPGAAGAVI